jgi:hypothetical protein
MRWHWDRFLYEYFIYPQPAIIPPVLHTHVSLLGTDTTDPFETAVPRDLVLLLLL